MTHFLYLLRTISPTKAQFLFFVSLLVHSEPYEPKPVLYAALTVVRGQSASMDLVRVETKSQVIIFLQLPQLPTWRRLIFDYHFSHSNRLYFLFCQSDGVWYPTLTSKVNVCVRLATNDLPFGRFIGWSICAHTTARYPTCRPHCAYETTVTASTHPNMHRTVCQRCGTAWATIQP